MPYPPIPRDEKNGTPLPVVWDEKNGTWKVYTGIVTLDCVVEEGTLLEEE